MIKPPYNQLILLEVLAKLTSGVVFSPFWLAICWIHASMALPSALPQGNY